MDISQIEKQILKRRAEMSVAYMTLRSLSHLQKSILVYLYDYTETIPYSGTAYQRYELEAFGVPWTPVKWHMGS